MAKKSPKTCCGKQTRCVQDFVESLNQEISCLLYMTASHWNFLAKPRRFVFVSVGSVYQPINLMSRLAPLAASCN